MFKPADDPAPPRDAKARHSSGYPTLQFIKGAWRGLRHFRGGQHGSNKQLGGEFVLAADTCVFAHRMTIMSSESSARE